MHLSFFKLILIWRFAQDSRPKHRDSRLKLIGIGGARIVVPLEAAVAFVFQLFSRPWYLLVHASRFKLGLEKESAAGTFRCSKSSAEFI